MELKAKGSLSSKGECEVKSVALIGETRYTCRRHDTHKHEKCTADRLESSKIRNLIVLWWRSPASNWWGWKRIHTTCWLDGYLVDYPCWLRFVTKRCWKMLSFKGNCLYWLVLVYVGVRDGGVWANTPELWWKISMHVRAILVCSSQRVTTCYPKFKSAKLI